jgi:hypothetical protein
MNLIDLIGVWTKELKGEKTEMEDTPWENAKPTMYDTN